MYFVKLHTFLLLFKLFITKDQTSSENVDFQRHVHRSLNVVRPEPDVRYRDQVWRIYHYMNLNIQEL